MSDPGRSAREIFRSVRIKNGSHQVGAASFDLYPPQTVGRSFLKNENLLEKITSKCSKNGHFQKKLYCCSELCHFFSRAQLFVAQ